MELGQYIPEHAIQKFENCAATLLMGCSSGSLSLNGCYASQGAHLCYLFVGFPVIVANLWEVTDNDIDRFGKAMLDCCLNERETV
ncbi:separin protein [Sarracenia purpurea var. burkii]